MSVDVLPAQNAGGDQIMFSVLALQQAFHAGDLFRDRHFTFKMGTLVF
jgi:hypothetical protein